MRITRRVEPGDLGLLEHPPRATLAFVRDGGVEIEPVAYALREGRHVFGVPPRVGPLPPKAKLLIDDGPWYFDLRGTWMRGPVEPREAPKGLTDEFEWYELIPEKTVAWHYGRMRQTDASS